MRGMSEVTLVRVVRYRWKIRHRRSHCGDDGESVLYRPTFRSGETCVATRFLLGDRICYMSMELIAARFAYLQLVVRW